MRSLGWIVAIVLLLPLHGCFSNLKERLVSCKLEAQRLYPNEPWIDDYVATCMETHGYKFSASSTACKSNAKSNEFKREPHCYVPTSLIGRLIYRLTAALY